MSGVKDTVKTYFGEFTDEDIKSFRKLYKESVELNEDIFIFKEQEVYVPFAKYLIEYMNSINKF
jgi:hypothetical protein